MTACTYQGVLRPSRRVFARRVRYIFVCHCLVFDGFLLGAHYFWAVHDIIIANLSGSIQFPVVANNSVVFSSIPMGDFGEGTQQGALWWDGGDYIYRQVSPIIVFRMYHFHESLTLYAVI